MFSTANYTERTSRRKANSIVMILVVSRSSEKQIVLEKDFTPEGNMKKNLLCELAQRR
jgi:hypothetical protein